MPSPTSPAARAPAAPNLAQLPLFPAAALRPPKAPARRPLRSPRVDRVLAHVAAWRVASVAQVLRAVAFPGSRGETTGRALLRAMVDHRLLATVRLWKGKGAASELAYVATAAGFRRIGKAGPVPPRPTEEAARARVQLAHVVHARASEGWKLVPATRAWARLRAWASSASARKPDGFALEAGVRNAISNRTEARVRVNLLVREAADQPAAVRLLVTPATPRGAVKVVGDLLRGGPALEFELVATTPEEEAACRATVARAARLRQRGRRFVAVVHEPVPPFSAAERRPRRPAGAAR